ncbi:hypothetical protein AYO22_02187 [Fonsecaea multimorphosa]|nr:hypothetical protein AYO22_02187 [Fonsecaea multimorphosa]
MNLRDYFSEPAAWDLLSVSYNPDARYAFVNFSSDAARLAAIRHAASRLFEGRRLDCRIRHESRGRSTKVNYGLNTIANRGPLGGASSMCCDRAKSLRSKVEEFAHFPEADRSSWGTEKYFILKSFSLDALYQSLETGRWHVPKRHVERLNHAFQTASKVILIFSVNGSGCFFGYATMRSEIHVDEQDLVPFNDQVHVISHHDLDTEDDYGSSEPGMDGDAQPQSLTRSRTESLASSDSTASSSSSSSISSVASGSIIYQPERRRIIWEASPTSLTHFPSLAASPSSPITTSHSTKLTCKCTFPIHPPTVPISALVPDPDTDNPYLYPQLDPHQHYSPSHATLEFDRFSSPCAIKWLCAQSLPFAAVRNLTNPWNADKPLHVARNVTPVEPQVARKLLECWAEAMQR